MILQIALAQINPTVGDLCGNRNKILANLNEARRIGADMVVFPEMAVTAYLLKPDFVKAAMCILDELGLASTGLTAVVGAVHADGDLYNAAAVLHDRRLAGLYRKQCFVQLRSFR